MRKRTDVLVMLVLLCGCGWLPGSARDSLSCRGDEEEVWAMRRHQVTFEQVEAEHKHLQGLPLWQEFRGRAEQGDEIWRFESSPESWPALMGRAGYFILREDRLIACIMTEMS